MRRLTRLVMLSVVLLCGKAGAAVLHVDPANSASRDGGDGDSGHPYRTLAYAMTKLGSGDTLLIAGGVYRDMLRFPDLDWSGAPTLIEPENGAHVMIKGSDVVSGWAPAEGGLFVKRPWTVNSQQVFVDGAALKQIGGTIFGGYPEKPGHPLAKLHAGQKGIWPGRTPGGIGEMTENSFYYDAGNQSLYIKVPLPTVAGHTIEVSVRPHLVFGQRLQNVTLKNLSFEHANTTAVNQTGAITLSGSRLVLQGIRVAHVDGSGLDVTGDQIVIRDSRADYCGQVGMKVRGRNDRLIGNETNFNNTRGFNKWWEAGGAKFVGAGGLRDSEVSGHRAIGNNGDGLWFDWMNDNNRIHDNVLAYNAGFGIQYEASQRGYIYDNYVFGNKQRGIYLPHSSASVVAHNLVASNGMEGVAVIDEGRSKQRKELRPRGNRLFGNILAWNGKAAIVLPAGLFDNSSDYNLIISSGDPPAFSLGWGSRESPVRKGLAAWQSATGQDTHSWNASVSVPDVLNEALGRKRSDVDWAPVMSVASRFRVPRTAQDGPVLPVANGLSPGPHR